jgi:CDP-2,3-bis-(O-geranylgeranyl)-sn-glycerol synthase
VDVPMQWLLIFKLLVLLTVANGAPVIATKLFGRFLNQQLDCGAAFIDGRSILGSSKTVRGIVLSIMATSAFAPILGFDWIDGFIIASAAMIGDLSSSFLKRRLSLPPSSRATGIDQIPECLLPAIAIRSALGLTVFDVISVVIIFFVGELLLSRLLFNWNIRDRPY